MIQKPLVSIGMPVYNGEKYIRQALDSLLSQDYENFELIISDNASTDQTSAICMGYAKKDSRICYYQNETNIGVTSNFLRVLELAHGDYFMWAACDDLWMPEFVCATVEQLEKDTRSSVAMSAVRRVLDNEITQDVVHFKDESDPSKMSHFELAMALAAGQLYHLYIYGLYRTDFIRIAASHFPTFVAGDRMFVCQVALATRFSYIDRVLHIRRVSSIPIAERLKDDPLGRKWQYVYAREKTMLAMGPYLWKSKLIPLLRKTYIPFLVARFAYLVMEPRLKSLVNSLLFRRTHIA